MSTSLTPSEFLMKNFLDEATVEFLASLDQSVAKYIINNAPGKPQAEKDQLAKAVDDLRKIMTSDPKILPFVKQMVAISVSLKPLICAANPWKVDYALNHLFKLWVGLRKSLKLPVPDAFKEYDNVETPPPHYGVQDKLFEKILKDNDYPDTLPEGSLPLKKIRYPENASEEMMIIIIGTLLNQQKHANFKALDSDDVKVRDEQLAELGLTLIIGVNEDTLVWSDKAKKLEAEKEFVEANGRLSFEFNEEVKRLRGKLKEGEQLAPEYEQILAKVKIPDEVISNGDSDGDGEDEEEKDDEEEEKKEASAKPKKSRFSAVLEKAMKLAMKSKDDTIVDISPIPSIIPNLVFRPFKELPRREVTVEVPKNMLAFFNSPLPGKVTTMAAGDKIRALDYTPKSVLTFIRDNGYDAADNSDVLFAAIVCKLVESETILNNDPTPLPAVANILPVPGQAGGPVVETYLQADVDKVITEGKLEVFARYARRVMDASFYYASQGAVDGSLGWFDSYTKVFGKITSERRFINLCDMIVTSGSIRNYVRTLKIGSVMKANDVLKYRLIRISTPELIFRALAMVTNDFIFRMIDHLALLEYFRFVKGGLMAQVAAGPLKVYLDGMYDPTEYTSIPGDIPVGDLMAIEEPPYNDRLIKQAKIILDVYGVDVGKWYQGERAIATMDTRDVYFKEVVKAIKMVDAERVKNIAEAIAAEMNIGDFGSDDFVGNVKGLVQTYNVDLAKLAPKVYD